MVFVDSFARVARTICLGRIVVSIFVLGTLHVLNPDEYIVRTNIRLMQEGRAFDANYHQNLSDDAVPVLLENLRRNEL